MNEWEKKLFIDQLNFAYKPGQISHSIFITSERKQ
jgi:hypothetical protein